MKRGCHFAFLKRCSEPSSIPLVKGVGSGQGAGAGLRFGSSRFTPGLCHAMNRPPEGSVGCGFSGFSGLLLCFHVPDTDRTSCQIWGTPSSPQLFSSYSSPPLFASRFTSDSADMASDVTSGTDAESGVDSRDGPTGPSVVVPECYWNACSH